MYASHVFYTKEIRQVVYVPLLTNGHYNRGQFLTFVERHLTTTVLYRLRTLTL